MVKEKVEQVDLLPLLPKVELHRHLIGSIRVETLVDVAIKNDIPLPANDLMRLKNLIVFREPTSNLRQFLQPLNVLGLCFFDKKTIARVAYEVVEDAVKDNIKLLELGIGPAFEASFHRLSLDEVFEGIIEGVKRAERRYEIKVNLLAGPTFKWKERKAHSPLQVLEASLLYREKVVGFTLSAETKEGTSFSKWKPRLKEEYISLANKAKEGGLAVTAHAGEAGDAQSVMDAVKYLKADRIGHGIKLVENLNILEHIVKMKIPLEICISSNIKSGVVKSFKEHPVKQLWERGAIITINTDDPTLCDNATLSKDYSILMKNFGFSYFEVKKLILNALTSTFLCQKEKNHLYRTFQKRFIELENTWTSKS